MAPCAVFDNLAQAYDWSVREVACRGRRVSGVEDEDSIGSHFGNILRPTRERLATTLEIRNPRALIVRNDLRPFKVSFTTSLFVWLLQGSQRLDELPLYGEKGLIFSENGVSMSALGYRARSLFGDQVSAAVSLLKRDPSSRRALILFGNGSDVINSPRDYPCPTSVQFFIRDNRLIPATTMRSQSVLKLLPYDVSLLGLLQAYIAAALRLQLENYFHTSSSVHIYEDEMDTARALMASTSRAGEFAPFSRRAALVPRLLDVASSLRSDPISSLAIESQNRAHSHTAEVFEDEAIAILLAVAASRLGLNNIANEQALRLPVGPLRNAVNEEIAE